MVMYFAIEMQIFFFFLTRVSIGSYFLFIRDLKADL